MSLPAAMAWGYLFPKQTPFVSDSTSAWVPQLLDPHAKGLGAGVFTMFQQDWDRLPDLRRLYGVAAVNSPAVTRERLENAGFEYVRRFAVLPNVAAPRWFIPLDCPARTTAAAFDIYTPARRSARAKVALARSAALLGVPGWYRDSVIVASRRLPGVERVLADLFPGRDLRLAISAGAPEPALNRKGSAAVVDSAGRILAFAKIGESELSERLLRREADALIALAGLGGRAPGLIYAGEVDGRYLIIQEALQGRPAAAALTPEHLSFLGALRGPPKRAVETKMVQELPGRVDRLNVYRAELAGALSTVLPAVERLVVPQTIVHGDFAPWNVRRRSGKICAFDWEYAEIDGLPLIDETHFRVQLCYQLGGWTAKRFHQHLRQLAAAKPLGLEPQQAKALYSIYVVDCLIRLLGEGYSLQNELVRWYAELLDLRMSAWDRQPDDCA